MLYSFTGGSDVANPEGVIRDSAANLYGTTFHGGSGFGVVFKLSPDGQETVLYSFNSGRDDGKFPDTGVVRDSAGNLYGTTTTGGRSGFGGVVYKVGPEGGETVLHSFTGGKDGAAPGAGVTLDGAGNVYGTASYGGPRTAGVVFKIDTTGKETVLYGFTGGSRRGLSAGGRHTRFVGQPIRDNY